MTSSISAIFLLLAGTPVGAQQAAVTPMSSTDIEAKISDLQKQLALVREKEAIQAITDEASAKTKADKARNYLASIGKPVLTKSSTASDETRVIAAAAEAAKTAGVVTTISTKPDGTKETKVQPRSQRELADSDSSSVKFGGINFGVGVAFSIDTGDNKRLKDATLVNGLVRVSQSENVNARIILESHYLFTPNDIFGITNIFGLSNVNKTEKDNETLYTEKSRKDWGFGPFIAIQPGKDDIIDAIGAGFMLGLRRPGEGNDSFNIGLGLIYDVNARILGDGITANQPLPIGETEIRYKTRDQKSLLLMTSYSF